MLWIVQYIFFEWRHETNLFKNIWENYGTIFTRSSHISPFVAEGYNAPTEDANSLYKHCGYFKAEEHLQGKFRVVTHWLDCGCMKTFLLLESCPGIFNLQNDKKTEKSCCQHGVNRQKSSNLVCSQTPLWCSFLSYVWLQLFLIMLVFLSQKLYTNCTFPELEPHHHINYTKLHRHRPKYIVIKCSVLWLLWEISTPVFCARYNIARMG